MGAPPAGNVPPVEELKATIRRQDTYSHTELLGAEQKKRLWLDWELFEQQFEVIK
jgi:hypothetical protein